VLIAQAKSSQLFALRFELSAFSFQLLSPKLPPYFSSLAAMGWFTLNQVTAG
jgi:hypothetical protein